jgi:KaiC/GvpD/RAD55 family RecA-like ATPase
VRTRGTPIARELPDADQQPHVTAAPELKEIGSLSRYASAAKRAADVGSPLPPLPTGLPTLDEITGGGLVVGKSLVLQGAPAAGKTCFALHLAKRYAAAGVLVTYLAADESDEALLIRLGQTEGLDRDLLQRANQDERAKLVQVCAALPTLVVLDPSVDGATIEDAAIDVRDRGPRGAARVLLVDSLHTAHTRAQVSTPTERIQHSCGVLRTVRNGGVLVIATAEMNRCAYRSRDPKDRINDMAAGAESRAIEYLSDVLLTLRSVTGTADTIEASATKNRLGRRGVTWRMAIDLKRSTLAECQIETVLGIALDAGDVKQIADATYLTDLRWRVIDKLASGGIIRSAKHAAEIVEGKTQRVLQVVARLEDEGIIVREKTGFSLVPGKVDEKRLNEWRAADRKKARTR